jgi:hypothetical protein
VHNVSASLTANFELDSASRSYSWWQKDKVYMHRDGGGTARKNRMEVDANNSQCHHTNLPENISHIISWQMEWLSANHLCKHAAHQLLLYQVQFLILSHRLCCTQSTVFERNKYGDNVNPIQNQKFSMWVHQS